MSEPDYIAAYEHASQNRRELEASEICGCFYCLETFPPQLIERWLKTGDGTALCPKCGIDSVIGSASGLPINLEFLERVNRHWFSTRSTPS